MVSSILTLGTIFLSLFLICGPAWAYESENDLFKDLTAFFTEYFQKALNPDGTAKEMKFDEYLELRNSYTTKFARHEKDALDVLNGVENFHDKQEAFFVRLLEWYRMILRKMNLSR